MREAVTIFPGLSGTITSGRTLRRYKKVFTNWRFDKFGSDLKIRRERY